MSALLDILNQQIGDNTLRQLSSQIDADPSSTRKAVAAALPLLIGSLARSTKQSPQQAQALDAALEQDHDGSLLDNLGAVLGRSSGGRSLMDAASALLGGVSMDRRAVDGDGILRHLLGPRRSAVEVGISRASGLDVKKVSQLLAILAPILMSALGKAKRARRLDAGGVAGLLQEEQATLERETAGTGPGLLSFLDADDDGQIADDVARIGAAVGSLGLMERLLGGTGKQRTSG